MDKPFSRIVVPLDGSALAKTALAPASELARRAGVPVTLFRWVPSRWQRLWAHDELESIADVDLRGIESDISLRTAADGLTVECLAREARVDDALICMTSHGRTGVGRTLMGSVAEDTISRSESPILMVGPNCSPAWPISHQRLVACLDGTEVGEHVLPAAQAWSTAFELPLWLVQVVGPGCAVARDGGDLLETGYLTSVAQALPVDADWDICHGSDPAKTLVDLTRTWPTGVIALASRRRHGWERITDGSVTMRVVRHSRCPVLVVPSEPAMAPEVGARVVATHG